MAAASSGLLVSTLLRYNLTAGLAEVVAGRIPSAKQWELAARLIELEQKYGGQYIVLRDNYCWGIDEESYAQNGSASGSGRYYQPGEVAAEAVLEEKRGLGEKGSSKGKEQMVAPTMSTNTTTSAKCLTGDESAIGGWND
eukprot:g14152.t1